MVVHNFGWAQIFGEVSSDFLSSVRETFFVKRTFFAPKLRFFSAQNLPLLGEYGESSERIKFRWDIAKSFGQINRGVDNYDLSVLDEEAMQEVNDKLKLDLFSRNWPSKDSFISNSFGVVAKTIDGEAASVAYSCAAFKQNIEIDIFTHPSHRKRGLAMLTCMKFIEICRDKNLTPCWDCYSNNIGSMALARRLGFSPEKYYTHYVIQ